MREAGRPALPAVYRDLLAPSFPPEELVTEALLAAGLDEGVLRLHVVGPDAQPVAAAVAESMHPSQAVLLAYLATKESSRGTGLGSRLLAAWLQDVVDTSDPSFVLAEVEHPGHHRGSAHHGDPAARLRFYARHGARIVDVPYVQGPVGPGQPPVFGLLLLALHVRADQLDPDGEHLLPTGELASALSGGHGPRPGHEERMVRAAQGRVRLLPVEEYARAAVAAPPVTPAGPPT